MVSVNNKISSTSLNWAISHILKEGDTDLLPVPFEYKIIKKDWKNIQQELLKIDISSHSWDSVRRFSVPKGVLSFRPICQLSPVDALLYAAIIKEIGKKIESKRASIQSDTVFSYRFQPKRNGGLFRTDYGWDKFWSTSLSFDLFPENPSSLR